MPVTRLYRKRLRRPRLRRKARIYPRPPAGASRHRSSKSRDRAGAQLSRRRWAVAIGCERQGGRPQPARACVRLGDARAVSALPHRVVGEPAEGRTGCGGPDRSVRLVRCSRALPHVASEPVGLFRRGNRPWCRTPSGDPAGVLLAALASILILLARVSHPHVALLGGIPGTNRYSDLTRHPENEVLSGVIAFRPEASLIYVNADSVLEAILNHVRGAG